MSVDKPRLYVIGCLVSLCLFVGVAPGFSAQTIDLSGRWNFALDRQNMGVAQSWYDRSLADKISLPGILESQGYGDEITARTPWVLSLYDRNWFERADYQAYTKPGNVKIPFLAQPVRHYVGVAWYEREIDIPAGWTGKRVQLFLERPHWESTVWLDGKKIGSARSLVASHEHELGSPTPGRHRIAIRVDNSLILPYRLDAHSVSDSLGMAWNGIVGKIELRATSPVWIKDTQVFATSQLSEHTIKVTIGNATGQAGSGVLIANGFRSPVSWTADAETQVEVKNHYPTNGRLPQWDEFHPALSKIEIILNGGQADDAKVVSFGYRDLEASGKKLILNGHEIYLRGTHDGGDFPLTGYPPTDVAFWKKRFQVVKDWGLNHVRFHSFCPPEAAFEAADELGIYLQPEPGMWNEVSPGTPMEKMLYEETDAMIRAYGNHPSYLMLAPSNEPKGRWKEAFDKWIAHYREVDPRRLYNNGTGHTEPTVPNLAEGTDFLTMQRIGPLPLRGNSAWFGKDYGASLNEINVPVLSHELGQWVAYPDYSVIKKFAGYMRPGNYEIFRDSLATHGLLTRNKDFASASGRFQLNCYKEEIEANLRTPGMSGYQLLDLHDYLGQGTALVGLLDPFWEPKGYVTAAEFRRFSGATVPLVRMDRKVYDDNDPLTAKVEIAHFGQEPIANAVASWSVVDERGRKVAGSEFPRKDIPIGKSTPLGDISLDLRPLGGPRAYKLVVRVRQTSRSVAPSRAITSKANGDRSGDRSYENDWPFWVYPSKAKEDKVPAGILITHSWDEAEAKLRAGGKVLYMPPKADLDWTSPPLDWVPVFWNRLMNPAWGRMLGLWIDKTHPALADFPTDSFNDWQWSSLLTRSRAMNLDKLPKDLQPIVQPIDDWNRNYKLGLVFEARVGRGKLLVATPDLENSLKRRLVARQLRRSLLAYMASPRFQPKTSITPENFREVFFDTQIMKKLASRVEGSPTASQAVDGDPNTFWTAGDQKDAERKPQALTIQFLKNTPVLFTGLVIMPRQNHREHEGDVRDYLIEISDNGRAWREAKRGALLSTFEPQRIDFSGPVQAKFLRFTSLSGFGSDKVTAIAELAVIYAGPKLPELLGEGEYSRSISASPDIDENVRPNDKKPIRP